MPKLKDSLFKISLFALVFQSSVIPQNVQAQDNHKPSLDIRKTAIESTVKSLIKSKDLNSLILTSKKYTKRRNVLLTKSALTTNQSQKSNKVVPGKVQWHVKRGDATKASKLSKKPLLVFHLMGNLDDRFC